MSFSLYDKNILIRSELSSEHVKKSPMLNRIFKSGLNSDVIGEKLEGKPEKNYQQKIIESKYDSNRYDNKEVTARNIMSESVVTLKENDSVNIAIKLFLKKRFRHIPVINQNAELIGVISDRDLLNISFNKQNYSHLLIKDLMVKDLICCLVDTNIREIAKVMLFEKVGSMLVKEEDELIGIVTRSDILRAIIKYGIIDLWV